MKYKIYITGFNGFVGRNIANYFKNLYLLFDYRSVSFDNSSKFDVVINLAGKANDLRNVSKPDDYYNVNTEFAKQIFDFFLASEAKVFITLSSVKVYSPRKIETMISIIFDFWGNESKSIQ